MKSWQIVTVFLAAVLACTIVLRADGAATATEVGQLEIQSDVVDAGEIVRGHQRDGYVRSPERGERTAPGAPCEARVRLHGRVVRRGDRAGSDRQGDGLGQDREIPRTDREVAHGDHERSRRSRPSC